MTPEEREFNRLLWELELVLTPIPPWQLSDDDLLPDLIPEDDDR